MRKSIISEIFITMLMMICLGVSCSGNVIPPEAGTSSVTVSIREAKNMTLTGSSPAASDVFWTYTLSKTDGSHGVGETTAETRMNGTSVTTSVSFGEWKAEVFGYRDEACTELVYLGTGTGTVSLGVPGSIAVTASTTTDATLARAIDGGTPKATSDLILMPVDVEGDPNKKIRSRIEWYLDGELFSTWMWTFLLPDLTPVGWVDSSNGVRIPSTGLVVNIEPGASRNLVAVVYDTTGNVVAAEGWDNQPYSLNCRHTVDGIISSGTVVINSFFDIDPSDEMPSNAIVIGFRESSKSISSSINTTDLTEAITFPYVAKYLGKEKDKYTPSELGLDKLYVTKGADLATSGAEKAWFGKTAAVGYLNSGIEISNIRTVRFASGIQAIPLRALNQCTEISTVEIPSGVTKIGDFAFYGCRELVDITIPASVTSIGGSAFAECKKLSLLLFPSSVTTIGPFALYGCSGLKNITVPTGITEIQNGLFSGCTGLTSVTLPDGITYIGQQSFYDCTSLVNIDIPTSVTSIGQIAFSECSSLTNITIPDGVTEIGSSAFSGCTGLNSVAIPSSVTTIGSSVFYGCTGLNSVTIPSSVMEIGGSVFSRCTGLTSITIPSSVTSIGNSAFEGCTGLNSVTIPSSVTTIGSSVFRDCTGLTSVTIPTGVTTIGRSLFDGCTGLNSVSIPSGVTSIGDRAFAECNNLYSIKIPSGVTSVGMYAFRGCTKLSKIYVDKTQGSLDLSNAGLPSSCTVLWRGQF